MNVEIVDQGVCPFCHDPIESDEETLIVSDRLVHKACHEWRFGRNRTPMDAAGDFSEAGGRTGSAGTHESM
ncbi:MAG TPA: hypothetical protein VEW69_11955 [Alphaproteobacteria bacterium]|nr:hypothetical protein [Alphaproteobacteria bacterium]